MRGFGVGPLAPGRTITAVPGAASRTQGARGLLARLMIALVLLTGVAGAVGMHCADGPNTAMFVAGGGHATLKPAAHTVGEKHSAVHTDHGTRDPGPTGGLLITCLVFLIAVVTAMLALRPRSLRSLAATLRAARPAIPKIVLPRAPRLVELCLLRT